MLTKANITIDEARGLVADAALWPAVRDFLWDFAPQVHGSWLEDLDMGKAFRPSDLHLSMKSSPRVKHFILAQLGIESCFHHFPKDDWSRLLLLDGATLESVVKWLGALACADGLRRVTDGAKVRELKAALPGVYPEVFGYTMYFKGVDFQCGDAEIQSGLEGISSIGFYALLSLLADVPPSLVSRLKFKLPRKLCASEPLHFEAKTCGKVVAKLLKLKFQEAYKLCC